MNQPTEIRGLENLVAIADPERISRIASLYNVTFVSATGRLAGTVGESTPLANGIAPIVAPLETFDAQRESARREAAIAGLAGALDLCKKALPLMSTKTSSARRIAFIAQLLTAFGTAAFLVSIGKTVPWVEYGLGTVTLAGSIVSLVANYVRNQQGAGAGVESDFTTLVGLQFDAGQLVASLQFSKSICAEGIHELHDLCTQAITVAKQVVEISARYGVLV